MELHERQQFDQLLLAAADRYVERIVQRCAGLDNAIAALSADAEGTGVWLGEFVDAVFAELLLDNSAGACFVLQALERRQVSAPPAGQVGDVLAAMARECFGSLLRVKALEAMQRAAASQPIGGRA